MSKKMKAEKSLETIKKRWISGDIAMRALQAPIFPPALLSQDDLNDLDQALLAAGIFKNKTRIHSFLAQALSHALAYTQKPYLSYDQKKLTRQSYGTKRSFGPHQKEVIRLLLCAAIFRAWRDYFNEEPRISRPLTPKYPNAVRSAFVSFAGDIFRIARMRKVEDRLIAYRAYECDLGLHKQLSKKK